MSRRLAWDRRALADMRDPGKRDEQLVRRIILAIEQYAAVDLGDVRKLAGSRDEYRIRVGDWLVPYRLEEGGLLMAISRVFNRRDVYR